mmetsp:Transcript_64807/g.183929  ORF Transcript_64807/g.183929 Transcript_64807/m.183929 type:complete len:213 (-) Transcript_64807:136-774(-)
MPQPLGMRPLAWRLPPELDPSGLGPTPAADETSAGSFAGCARTRHFALREDASSGHRRSKSAAYYPRFSGTRRVCALANNSERMRLALQPDPWSASPRDVIVDRQLSGCGSLYATHTSKGHSSTLVWRSAGPVEPVHSEEPDDDSVFYATPRGMTANKINFEAHRALREMQPNKCMSMSARARFGKGTTTGSAASEEKLLPLRVEVRGKYTG